MTLYPNNEDYKLYYSQSLYKVGGATVECRQQGGCTWMSAAGALSTARLAHRAYLLDDLRMTLVHARVFYWRQWLQLARWVTAHEASAAERQHRASEHVGLERANPPARAPWRVVNASKIVSRAVLCPSTAWVRASRAQWTH